MFVNKNRDLHSLSVVSALHGMHDACNAVHIHAFPLRC